MYKYGVLILLVFIIPMDWVVWNSVMTRNCGHRSWRQVTEDNLKQLLEMR